LPDEVERAAGRLAAIALADQPDLAAEILGAIQRHDREREVEGLPPSGLSDNGLDLLNALEGMPRYPALAEGLLERDDLDPVLRVRITRQLESQPLRVAEKRLREDRTRKVGSVFNRIAAPVSRFFLGGGLPALESGRAALASLLVMHSFPKATTQERQALRAYQEFLARQPDSPERPWVEKRVERYEKELREQLFGETLDAAERAMEVRQPDAALVHLERGERLIPEDWRTRELREQARALSSGSLSTTRKRPSWSGSPSRCCRPRRMRSPATPPHGSSDKAAARSAMRCSSCRPTGTWPTPRKTPSSERCTS
jgi:hypothetical protein